MKNIFQRLGTKARAHKIITSAIALVLLFGVYEAFAYASKANTSTQYVVSPAAIGSIRQTVSGTGQVSSANQLDVTSQVSGPITSINVKVGDQVTKGQLLATIDSTTARNQLQSAQLSYDQLVQPPKPGDIENAQNTLDKSYTDAWNAVRSSFVDLQTVMTGVNSMLYEQSGFFGPGRSDFLSTTAQTYRSNAGTSFDKAKASYQSALADYEKMSDNIATSSIETMSSETDDTLKLTAASLQALQNAVNFVTTNQPDYNSNMASTAISNVSSWLQTINNDVAANASARSAIASARNSYDNLLNGPDDLQIASSQLSVNQAQQAYSNYFVRAPFDGIVGRIPVSQYQQAGASTVIATIVGNEKIANISLDEVDAAKVAPGQKVAITFDALPDLTASGTVEQADLVGTVSGGVVSYNVRIGIDTHDNQIRPGMSLNATITTNEKDGVLMVPTAAVKSQGSQKYVQVLNSDIVSAYIGSQRPGSGSASGAGSGTFASSTGSASQAGGTASSTRRFGAVGGTGSRQFSLTIPSNTAPQNVSVTTGISDDTNTEITGGLTPREWVVTRIVNGSSAQTSAPSILSAFGGGNRAAGGAAGTRTVRIGG